MAFLARIRSFWRNALHRSDMERDMSDELQFHLVRRADDLVERRGLPPDEAMRIARLEFGSVEKYKEEARQSLGLRLVDETGGDLRYAFRSFAKNKAFTAGRRWDTGARHRRQHRDFQLDGCGPGAAAASRTTRRAGPAASPAAGRGPETRLHERTMGSDSRPAGCAFVGCSPGALLHSRSSSPSAGCVQNVDGFMVSGNYFNTLGVTPAAGRVIADADDHRGCPPVAVLSYGFWQTHFGGTDSALGRTLTLNRQPFQVIGVSAPRFSRRGGREEV